jgi:arylformamidase
VDAIALEDCCGPAVVVEVRPAGQHITAADLHTARVPAGTERVLLKTSNGDLWDAPSFREDFVAVELDAAQWLTARGTKLLGIDYLSVAPFGRSKPVHVELLSKGCLVLEGIRLTGIEPGEYTLACFPLRIEGGDGSPVRAVLMR